MNLIKHKKYYLFLFFIIIAILLVYKGSHKSSKNILRDPPITFVDATFVKQSTIPIEVSTIGTLVAAQHTEITPEIAGQVSKVFFQDGVFVKKDSILIQLDDAVFRSKMDSSKANLVFSEADYNRKKILAKKGAISQQAVDQALADLKEKRAAAEESAVKISKMKLIAPFDGVLGKVTVSPGDYVTVGQALVSLTDIQNLRVEYSLPEKYLSEIKLGQEIFFTTNAYPNQKFIGKITYISPTINSAERTISLYASVLNNDRRLTSGLFVNVNHQLGFVQNVLTIPTASLVPTIDGQHVFKIIDNKVLSIPIKLGEWSSNSVQVLSGLSLNDQIVIAGQLKLKDGMTVQVTS